MIRRITGRAELHCALLRWALVLAATSFIGVATAEPLLIEIVRAEVGFDQRIGQPIISFTMAEASRRLFAEFTRQNVGRAMEVRVDGRVIMTPVIREPIVGGTGQLLGGFSTAEANALAERLSTGNAKIEVEIVPK